MGFPCFLAVGFLLSYVKILKYGSLNNIPDNCGRIGKDKKKKT